jgi:hypothetical protein
MAGFICRLILHQTLLLQETLLVQETLLLHQTILRGGADFLVRVLLQEKVVANRVKHAKEKNRLATGQVGALNIEEK